MQMVRPFKAAAAGAAATAPEKPLYIAPARVYNTHTHMHHGVVCVYLCIHSACIYYLCI